MEQRAAYVATVAVSLVIGIQCAHAQVELGFKMPSRNVYCIIEDAADSQPTDLRCDIQQMNNPMPAPPSNCPLSWGDAFSVTQNGSSGRMVCHGDTTKHDDLPVLTYGSVWNQRGFSCKSETSGLTCVNVRGHGFTLSRASQRTF